MQGVDYQFLRSRTHPVGQNLKHYRENLPAIHARAPAIELSKATKPPNGYYFGPRQPSARPRGWCRTTCGRSAHLLSESLGDEEVVVVAVTHPAQLEYSNRSTTKR